MMYSISTPPIARELSSSIVELNKNNLLTHSNLELLFSAPDFLAPINTVLRYISSLSPHLLTQENFELLVQHAPHAQDYQNVLDNLVSTDESMVTEKVLLRILESGERAKKVEYSILKANNHFAFRFFKEGSDSEESESESESEEEQFDSEKNNHPQG